MGLSRLTEKMARYRDKVKRGKANKIKPAHVRKVLKKLHAKEAELLLDRAKAGNSDKRHRLDRKIDVARKQIDRGEWLLDQIE